MAFITAPEFQQVFSTPLLQFSEQSQSTCNYTNVIMCSASKTRTITVQAVVPFTCGNTLTDIRDNKTYPTVQIGTHC